MTLRLESERMFVGVLAAVVLHALLLIVVHKLLDLDHRLDTGPLTIQLIGPVAREATGQERTQPVPRSAPKRQEAPAPVAAKAAPQPVAAERPQPRPAPAAARPAPAPQAAVPVAPQPRAETADAPAAPAQQPWTATMRKEFDSAQVRGRAGLNAQASAAGEPAAVTVPIAGPAAPAGAAVSQGVLSASFQQGIARPADESVYAKSASSPMPNARIARDPGADSAVPVVRDPGLAGPGREAVASTPVRMSGTPTASSGVAAGSDTASPAPSSMPISYASPGSAKSAPVDATVYGGAPAPAAEAPSVESRIGDLDRALDSGGRAAAGSAAGETVRQEEAAGGPAGRDPRLPEGWNVSGSLGLRPLLNVIHPALPDRYPDEIVQMTVRVLIRVDPAGWVRVERFEQDSGSTELNNEITKTLRQWRYEPVDDRDPVFGEVTIQIRSRSN